MNNYKWYLNNPIVHILFMTTIIMIVQELNSLMQVYKVAGNIFKKSKWWWYAQMCVGFLELVEKPSFAERHVWAAHSHMVSESFLITLSVAEKWQRVAERNFVSLSYSKIISIRQNENERKKSKKKCPPDGA